MKIRIWHKPSNRWLNPEKTYISALDGAVFEYSMNQNGVFSSHYKLWSVHDCVIQLFTGLKDANGREIFQGDIVEKFLGSYDPYNQDVTYSSEGQVFVINCDLIGGCHLFQDGEPCKINIVGNVFDNPELLNQK